MQNNPRPLFVKCPKCGCGNPPTLKACRNCNTQSGDQTFNRQPPPVSASKKYFRKLWLLIPILLLLFGVRYFVSYGQVTIRKRSDEVEKSLGIKPINDQNIEMPPGAWYKRSLKSWIWEKPSTEDVLSKEIEVTGGWKALKPFKSIQIRGKFYTSGCETEPKIQNIPSSTSINLKFKAPDKYLKEQIDILSNDDRRTELTVSNGTGVFQTSYTNYSKPKSFSRVTDQAANFNADFFTVTQNYAAAYYDFSDVSISKLPNKRVVYVVTAYKENASADGVPIAVGFSFDVVTGRLIGMNGITFLDYQKVDNVYLPFKICTYDNYNGRGSQLLVDNWILDAPVPDSDFEIGANDYYGR